MNGQRIASIADMQWVLHHLPAAAARVEVETSGSYAAYSLDGSGWKQYDFSWRSVHVECVAAITSSGHR